MSDFFISEMLVLGLLLPPLLRPFSKSLKNSKAVPLLPFLDFFICLSVIAGQGPSISFVPVLFIVTACIITESSRFVKLCTGVPNNFYGVFACTIRGFLLSALVSAGVFSFIIESNNFIEEKEKIFYTPLLKNEKDSLPYGFLYKKREETSGTSESSAKPLVIILNHLEQTTSKPKVITLYLAKKGFEVMEIHSLQNPRSFMPRLEEFICVVKALFARQFPQPEKLKSSSKNLAALDKAISTFGKNRPVFAFAEGASTDLLIQFASNRTPLAGAFILLSEQEPLNIQTENENSFMQEAKNSTAFDLNSAEKSVFFLLQIPEKFPGMSNLYQTDAAAVFLCKKLAAETEFSESKNINKNAADNPDLETAKLLEKWISARTEFLSRSPSEVLPQTAF